MPDADDPSFDVRLRRPQDESTAVLDESWVAEPSAVPRARAAAAAVASAAGATQEVVNDVRLAVSEAATNVVLHAYVGAEPGLVGLRAWLRDRHLEVEVRDNGGGVRARPDSPGLGIGLSLITAVTESVTITSSAPDSNRVIMTFHLDAVHHPIA